MNEKKYGTRLNCFSPLVMIITFIVEMLLALYAFAKSRESKSDLGIVTVLVFLAMFQLAEYQVCEGSNILTWSRIGFFFITFLPVTGMYLLSKFNKNNFVLKIGMLIAVLFAGYFTLAPDAIGNATCGGNYIIFDLQNTVGMLYGYYYFGFLLLGIWIASNGIYDSKNKNPIKQALKWFIIGYLSFIGPLTAVYIFIPITRVAVASIMCGFAVIFAFILTFKVAPIYHRYVKVNHKKTK